MKWVRLVVCRRTEAHRPHAWGRRRFCSGGWDSRTHAAPDDGNGDAGGRSAR